MRKRLYTNKTVDSRFLNLFNCIQIEKYVVKPVFKFPVLKIKIKGYYMKLQRVNKFFLFSTHSNNTYYVKMSSSLKIFYCFFEIISQLYWF